MYAGVSSGGQDVINVVPPVAVAKCDIRISPHTPPQDIMHILDGW